MMARLSIVCAAVLLSAASQRTDPASRATRFVDSLVARMTLEEKLGQLTQVPGRWGDTGPVVPEGGEDEIRRGHVGSFLGVFGAGYTRRMQEVALQSRLKIPLLFAHDVIHGFRTIFPVSIAEAASWDPQAWSEPRASPRRKQAAGLLDLRADGRHRARCTIGTHRRGRERIRTSARSWLPRVCAASRGRT